MALIKCPECGKEVSDTCETCIHCGYRLKNVAKIEPQADDFVIGKRSGVNNDQTTAIVLIIVGVVLLWGIVGIILLIIGLYMLSQNKQIKHECAYYHKLSNEISFYSESDEELRVIPLDIMKTERNDGKLQVTVIGRDSVFVCGKISETDYNNFTKYLEQIKLGTFQGL